jgi:hypothetical protein
VLIFAAGAAIGSVVTWRYFKTRYELVEEDFEAADETVDEEESEEDPTKEPVEVKSSLTNKPPLKEYVKMVKNLGYSDVEEANTDEDDEDVKDVYEPYIIHPEEYGEIHAYETLSLNYYADGVLTDDLDNRIEDVESMVPADFADHYGEFEDDAVFVRNDERQCDYEILRDTRNYADVFEESLHPAEDE